MSKSSYPLNALRAFEASARKLSFAKAADELNVTPAAISHQVKKLEEYLGVLLFRRLPKGILLSESGQVLWSDLHDVFSDLDRAMLKALEHRDTAPLTISVAPSFAVKWLVPRLQKFTLSHPDSDIRMLSGLNLIDFQSDEFDAAIRFGKGDYPNLVVIKLFDETVTPMCSPRLLDKSLPLRRPHDLQHHMLLQDDSLDYAFGAPAWKSWLNVAGVNDVDPGKGLKFGQPDHALQAAIDGGGVALGWRHMASDDLAAGRLVMPFDIDMKIGSAFYLVYPEAYKARKNIKEFRDWLVAQADLQAG